MKRTPRHQPAPELDVITTEGQRWRLSDQRPRSLTMVVFYRGLHCPASESYLRRLDVKREEFARRGVEVIAISCDNRERAQRARHEWGLIGLKVGYGLKAASALDWGLHIIRGIGDSALPEFAEPGIFLVDREGVLRWGTTGRRSTETGVPPQRSRQAGFGSRYQAAEQPLQ